MVKHVMVKQFWLKIRLRKKYFQGGTDVVYRSQQEEIILFIEKSIYSALDFFVPQRNKLSILLWFLQGIQGLRGRPGSRGDMGPIVSIYGVVLVN